VHPRLARRAVAEPAQRRAHGTLLVGPDAQRRPSRGGFTRSLPVLIIVGELDPILPPTASEELLAALPPGVARLHVLPGAAHSGRDLVAAGALDIVREFLLEEAAGAAGPPTR